MDSTVTGQGKVARRKNVKTVKHNSFLCC